MSGREVTEGTVPSLLNSSFYSSSSINTLDHAKNFRNSLILRDLSDQSFTSSLKSKDSQHDQAGQADSSKWTRPILREEETKTMKMTTSPSLSALAGILNEKNRQAQRSVKNVGEKSDNLIIEEAEESLSDGAAGKDDQIISPNLIDVDDTNNVHFPKVNGTAGGYVSEQPDFLTSPKKEVYSTERFKNTVHQDGDDTSKKQTGSVVSGCETHDLPRATKNVTEPRQRSLSANLTIDQTNDTSSPSNPNKKKKNLFSFLRKRSSGENTSREKLPKDGKVEMTNSTSFSARSTLNSSYSSTKIPRKSYSSSNIFNTFRKNKDYKRGTDDDAYKEVDQPVTNEKPKPAPRLPAKKEGGCLDGNKNARAQQGIRGRKPTPLNFEHISAIESISKEGTVKSQSGESKSIKLESPEVSDELKEEIQSPVDARLDTGEALFPKSLNKHEVDSIVSLERSRSTKSNKRSSTGSHRRSFTDTLSMNAQNEGMFVTEAVPVILSSPDLSKSPTSSILRNGKFEATEISAVDSIMYNYQPTRSPAETLDGGLSLDASGNRSSFSMNSIEEKMNEFTLDSDQDLSKEVPTTKSLPEKDLEEDPELMSDIMEFASLINFGDGINLEIDTGIPDENYRTVRPTQCVAHSTQDVQNLENQDSVLVNQSGHDVEGGGLGLSFDADTGNGSVLQNIEAAHFQEDAGVVSYDNLNQDDGFENEDFNELGRKYNSMLEIEQVPADPQVARPISMSFQGLKAPTFNVSAIPESPFKTPAVSSWSSEKDSFAAVSFSSRIVLFDTYGEEEYDRRPEIATCNQLTPQLAQLIKAELNELKCEMEVHEESRCYTHFY